MPYYQGLKEPTPDNKRIVERLLDLRAHLKEIPERTLDKTLLLATWNIREFDSPAYGTRLAESFYYIAEIISHFDIVAVQEVRKNLDALERLKRLLGPRWDYIFTDVTQGTQGNDERMAFLYDTRKVRFGGLAGELVLPPLEKEHVYTPVLQLARTPFICGFSAGWTDFMISSVHILYGDDVPDEPRRAAEIVKVSEFLRDRVNDDEEWSRNLILLGDFNIFKVTDATMRIIEDAGFKIPDKLKGAPPSSIGGKKFDQIAFQTRTNKFAFTENAGVFDYYRSVFRDEDETTYAPRMGAAYLKTEKGQDRTTAQKRTYYRSNWRTHQMSDHFPMWIEMRIDFSDEYLTGLHP